MKGLIRNNFYTVAGSLKITILVSFIAMIAVAIAGIYFPNNDTLIISVIGGILGGIGALSGTAIQKDSVTKWNKFELTMPISRNDVIRARYISFALYILMGVFLAILSVLLFYAVADPVKLESLVSGFSFGLAFAISIPTFMMPFVLIFGTDKNDALLMVSIIISLGLFFGSMVLFAPALKGLPNAMLLPRLGYLVFSILLFFLSYLLSVCLYKKKEL